MRHSPWPYGAYSLVGTDGKQVTFIEIGQKGSCAIRGDYRNAEERINSSCIVYIQAVMCSFVYFSEIAHQKAISGLFAAKFDGYLFVLIIIYFSGIPSFLKHSSVPLQPSMFCLSSVTLYGFLLLFQPLNTRLGYTWPLVSIYTFPWH